MSNTLYRPEIDGLRAIAVLAVVVFHFNPAWLPGGFLGVDIFFVISGFLITSIIYESIIKKSFSFKVFYIRRIKRILPVFYVVTAATLIFGYFILFPIDYKSVGNSALAATLFLGNFRFALMGDYFQEDMTKPLLHLWSLAVEEQFYFIWPTVLIVICKFVKDKKNILFIILLLTIASFLLAQTLSVNSLYATFSYFLLPTRMGELFIGCALAIYKIDIRNKFINNIITTIGGLILIISLIVIDKSSVFPGWNAFYPCLGTALIIMGGSSSYLNKFISLKPFIFIGLISYSLYLWHWPVLTFIRYSNPGYEFTFLSAALVMIGLVILSYLSLIFVEHKARLSKISDRNVIICYFVLPAIFIIIVSLFISKTGGVPQRYNLTKEMTSIETIGCHGSLTKDICFLSKNEKLQKTALLIGDSHAGHFGHFFAKLSNNYNISLIDSSSPGCAFYSKDISNLKCEKSKERIETLLTKVSTVIIAKRFDDIFQRQKFIDEFSLFLERLINRDIQVLVLAQVPLHNDPLFLNHYIQQNVNGNILDKRKEPNSIYLKANRRIHTIINSKDNVRFLDLSPIFCNEKECLLIDDKGFPLYFDDDHLTAYGAEWASERLLRNKEFNWLLPFLINE